METIPFNQISGHPMVLEYLSNVLKNGPVGHAYLFYGPDGVGKQTIAHRFSMALLCDQLTPSGDACGQCDSCRRFNHEAHPNFQLLAKEGKQSYKIEQLRELQSNVALGAIHGSRRVYLIPEAESMLPSSANAILKTLEEPSKGVVFILVSSNWLALLPTIISRCQQVRFGRLPTTTVKTILQSRTTLSEPELLLLAQISEGSAGKGMGLANPAVFAFRKALLSKLANHKPKDVASALAIPKFIIDQRKILENEMDLKLDMLIIYDWIIYWLRDLLVYRLTKDSEQLINQDYKDAIASICTQWSWAAIRSAIQQLELLKYLSSKNLNPTFSLETVFLNAYQSFS